MGEVSNEIFFILGLDNHIVDIGHNVLMELLREVTLDFLLVGGANVF